MDEDMWMDVSKRESKSVSIREREGGRSKECARHDRYVAFMSQRETDPSWYREPGIAASSFN